MHNCTCTGSLFQFYFLQDLPPPYTHTHTHARAKHISCNVNAPISTPWMKTDIFCWRNSNSSLNTWTLSTRSISLNVVAHVSVLKIVCYSEKKKKHTISSYLRKQKYTWQQQQKGRYVEVDLVCPDPSLFLLFLWDSNGAKIYASVSKALEFFLFRQYALKKNEEEKKYVRERVKCSL